MVNSESKKKKKKKKKKKCGGIEMILFLKIFSQGSFEYLLKYLNLLLT